MRVTARATEIAKSIVKVVVSGITTVTSTLSMRPQNPLARLGLRLLTGFVLPLLGFVCVIVRLNPWAMENLRTQWVGSNTLIPSDGNGTVWFYYWMLKSWLEAKPLLVPDIVCAPTGEALGMNFPNQVDAWLAMPFLYLGGFPTGYNLFILSIPLLGAFGAWLFLKSVIRSRLLAWCGAVLYGYNAYTIVEIVDGRPVTGLVFALPLVLWAWNRTLQAPTRNTSIAWGIVTGLLGGLNYWAYIPFALFLVPVALLMACLHLLELPSQGGLVARLRGAVRPLLLGFLALGVGGMVSLPYVHAILVERPQVMRAVAAGGEPQPVPSIVSMDYWQGLLDAIEGNRRVSQSAPVSADALDARIQRVQANAQHWQWPWLRPFGESARRLYLPPLLLLALLGVLPWWGRRGGLWALVTLLCYVTTLGPYLTGITDRGELYYVTIDSQRLTLPLEWLLRRFHKLAEFLRPYRIYPLLLISLLTTIGVGAQQMLEAMSRRLEHWMAEGERNPPSAGPVHVPNPFSLQRGVTLLGGLLGVYLTWWTLVLMTHAQQNLRFHPNPWKPSPFFYQLRDEPGNFSIVELPMGEGHATAVYQVVHERPRAEGHHDLLKSISDSEPPETCYQHPFLRALWRYEREIAWNGQDSTIDPALDPALIGQAVDAGFRYLLLYPEAYGARVVPGRVKEPVALEKDLRKRLGPPVFEDETLLAWRLDRVSLQSLPLEKDSAKPAQTTTILSPQAPVAP